MPLLFALLALFTPGPDIRAAQVSALVSAVRRWALAESLTGVMVFDGVGLCIYLEGERDAVLRCLEHLQLDRRDAEIEAVSHGRLEERRFTRFSTGYAHDDDVPTSERLRALDDEGALQAFLALAPAFDLDF